MIDPARTCIALGPLALYLLVIGVINVSRRPFVTTGSRDLAALGVGVSGLVLIGPIELFTSTSLALSLGIMYWVLILGLFASGCLMAVLHVRPRLVIYNTTPSQLSTPLIEAAKEMDSEAHWAGETLVMPAWNTQLTLEPFSVLRNVSLVPTGESLSPTLIRYLEAGLRFRLSENDVKVDAASRSGIGFALLAAGLAMTVMMIAFWVQDPKAVTQGIMEMLGTS